MPSNDSSAISSKGATTITTQTRLGIAILVAGGLLGTLGDQLLRAGPWGLNATLWMALFTVVLAGYYRAFNPESPISHLWLFAVVILFAVLLAWRDSVPLKLMCLFAAGIAFLLIPLAGRGVPFGALPLNGYVFELASVGLSAAAGAPLLLFKDIRWSELKHSERTSNMVRLARGLAIALPLVVIFGALFVAADAEFEEIVKRIFDIDLVVLIRHLFLAGFIFWAAAGVMRSVFFRSELREQLLSWQGRPSIGILEAGLVLGLLDVLFLGFVLVQLHYLFGGAELVATARDLTYAQYARRGFFELVTVAGLVLPLLLGLHWLLRKENPRDEKTFTWLAGTLMGLLVVVMISAAHRLLLYQREYGITEQRIYALVFMAWLAVVLAWFSLTVLRGARNRFAFGALVSGLAAIFCLCVLNPDALIVRVNSARAAEGKRFDARYLTRLSLDAAPPLIEALPSYSEQDRGIIAAHLIESLRESAEEDWRTWSYSRAAALRLIAAREDALLLMAEKAAAPNLQH